MSSETRKAIGLILIYTAILFFLIGLAGQMKMDFHSRQTIATSGFITAGVLAAAGVSMLVLSRSSKRP